MSGRTAVPPPAERSTRPSTRRRLVGRSRPTGGEEEEQQRGPARAGGPGGRLLGAPGRMLRRVPRAAWACAIIATLSAACWSLVTPPFQAPDEPSHFAYVQYLAETGRLPTSSL